MDGCKCGPQSGGDKSRGLGMTVTLLLSPSLLQLTFPESDQHGLVESWLSGRAWSTETSLETCSLVVDWFPQDRR